MEVEARWSIILNTLKKYVVYQCGNCGLPQYARNDRATRQCIKCTFINDLTNHQKIKVLLQTDNVKEAFEAVAYAKMNRDVFPQRLHTYTQRHTHFLRKANK